MVPSSPIQPPQTVVYGPIESRRFGLSLGINPLGSSKVCSFDCPYCDLGRTEIRMNQIKKDHVFPTTEELNLALRDRLRQIIRDQVPVKAIVISGNGEPTLSPQFPEMVEVCLAVMKEFSCQLPTVLLTNGLHFDSRKTVQAANQLSERMVKLDAGSDDMMKLMNEPLVRASVSRVTTGARLLKDCILQSMFVRGSIDNTKPEHLEEWMELVGIIQPKTVHLMSFHRPPAISGLEPVSEDDLYAIASRLKRRSIESVVFV